MKIIVCIKQVPVRDSQLRVATVEQLERPIGYPSAVRIMKGHTQYRFPRSSLIAR